ncbi:MAG: deoxyribodipyrimidine photo-lyase, partial [Deltaproteobacteria bacterium]
MRAVFWFRSDLRLRDNRGLAAVAARARELTPVFVLDPRLLTGPRAGAR